MRWGWHAHPSSSTNRNVETIAGLRPSVAECELWMGEQECSWASPVTKYMDWPHPRVVRVLMAYARRHAGRPGGAVHMWFAFLGATYGAHPGLKRAFAEWEGMDIGYASGCSLSIVHDVLYGIPVSKADMLRLVAGSSKGHLIPIAKDQWHLLEWAEDPVQDESQAYRCLRRLWDGNTIDAIDTLERNRRLSMACHYPALLWPLRLISGMEPLSWISSGRCACGVMHACDAQGTYVSWGATITSHETMDDDSTSRDDGFPLLASCFLYPNLMSGMFCYFCRGHGSHGVCYGWLNLDTTARRCVSRTTAQSGVCGTSESENTSESKSGRDREKRNNKKKID